MNYIYKVWKYKMLSTMQNNYVQNIVDPYSSTHNKC